MDGPPDAEVCAAAADVPRHRRVDCRVVRGFVVGEKRGGRHDLPRLAIAALRDIFGDPRLLYRMVSFGRETFDRRDLLPPERFDGRDARPDRLAVDMDGAGAAEGAPASEFRSGQAERIAQDPEERGALLSGDGAALAVDVDRVFRHRW